MEPKPSDSAWADIQSAEERLQRLARARAVTAACHRALVRAGDEGQLLREMCRIAVEKGGYRAAWVGLVRHDARCTIEPVASAGDPGLLSDIKASWADNERGRGPAGLAVRTRRAQFVRDIRAAVPAARWQQAVLSRGYQSAASFPLLYEVEAIGVFGIFATEPQAFDDEELELLNELADDIAYGLHRLRLREAQRQAEHRVAESEQRFHAVFDLAPVGINHVAPDGRILLANPFFERLLGYERGELAGANIKSNDFTFAEDAESLKPLFAQRERLHAGLIESFRGTRRYRRKDGTEVWAGLTVAAIRDASGQVLYDITAVEDISERVRAERLQALEHAVVRSLASADSAMAGVTEVIRSFCEADDWDCGRYFAADAHGALHLAAHWHGSQHPALQRFIAESASVTLAPPRALIGEVWQTGQPLWSADASSDPRLREGSLARRAGTRGTFAFIVVSGDARLGVLIFSSFKSKQPDDRLIRAAKSIGSQIGQFLQRKAAEEELRRFRAAMDFSIDAITLVDPVRMRIIDANKTACEQLGCTREELLALPPFEVAGRSREQQAAIYEALIAGRGQTGPIIGKRVRRDGTSFPVEIYRQAFAANDGYTIVVILRDITQRQRAEGLSNLEHLVARSLAAGDDASATMRSVMQAMCECEGWDCGRYLRVDEQAGVLRFSEFWSMPGAGVERLLEVSRNITVTPGSGLAGRSWLTGEPLWVPDITTDGRALPAAFAAPDSVIRGVFTFPLTAEGKTIGVLAFNSREIREPDEALLSAVRAIGSQIGQFLQRKSAEEALRESENRTRVQGQRQRVIAELSQNTLASSELIPVLRQAVDLVTTTLAVDCCDVTRVDTDQGRLTCLAATGWTAEWPGFQGVRLNAGGPLDSVLVRSEPVVVDDYEQHPQFASSLLAQWGVRSGMLMPIRAPSGAFVLGVHSKQPRAFTEDDASFLRSIANVLAVAMERTRAADRLAYLAQFDSLTGLPNRHLFQDRLVQSLAQAKRTGAAMAILFIDLDRFKLVNDTLGHASGDQLLKQAAARLLRCVRASDTVGRLGGDEFSAILLDLARVGDAGVVAQKIIDSLAQPFAISGNEIYVSASIGITLFPNDGEEASALVVNADAAMYRAKEQGRNNYQYFTPEMNVRAVQRLQMESQLRRALERREFLLHFQPRVNLRTGAISGLEALLRWQHPDRGLVSPVEFIPVLEDTNLIVPVGDWVLAEACSQIRLWRAAGLAVPPLAVNLSVRQFQQKDLEATVLRLLNEACISPNDLQFEITESLLMSDPEAVARVLRRLSDAGVKLSVDDFGTGYSSLAYLKRFPLYALKIDRAFVRDLTQDPEDAAITVAIINLAHSLQLQVVAEGVETQAQLDFLARHGCDEIQGFFFSKAVPGPECEALLREGKRLTPPPRRRARARPAP